MATEELLVTLGLNANEFDSTLKSVTKELKRAEQEFKTTEKALGSFENETDGLKSKMESLEKVLSAQKNVVNQYKAEIDKTSNVLKEQVSKQNELKQSIETTKSALEKSKNQFGENSAETQKLQKELSNLERQFDKSKTGIQKTVERLKDLESQSKQSELKTQGLEKEIQELQNELNNINTDTAQKELEELDETSGKIGGNFSKLGLAVGGGLLAVGTAVAGIGVMAVKSADELQGAMNKLQSSTGATAEEMNELTDVVKGVYGNNFGESFEEVADAVALVRQHLDGTGEDLQNVTELAMGFSRAFGYDVGESTRSAKAMMDQFGLSAEESFNLMAQGSQKGLDFSGELLDTINEYSVHFKQAGYSAEDMFNIMYAGAENGAFNLDKVGDAVKEMNLKLRDQSASDGLKALGYNAEDVAKKMNAGGEVAKETFNNILRDLANVNDKTLQNTIGTELMGTMFEDLGVNAVASLTAVSGEFDSTYNTMDAINQIQFNTFGEALDGMKRMLETNVLIPIGDLILPLLNDFANWFLTDGKMYLEMFGDVVNTVMPVVQEVFGTVFDSVITIFNAVTEMFFTNTGEMGSTWENLMSVLQAYWNDYGQPLFDTISTIVQVFVDLWVALMPTIADIFSTAIDVIKTVYDTVFKPVFDFIVVIVQDVAELFAQKMPMIAQIVQGAWQTIKLLWESVLKPVFSLIGSTIEYLLVFIQPLWKLFVNCVSIAFDGIAIVWNGVLRPVLNLIITVVGTVVSGVATAMATFKNVVSTAMSFVLTPIQKVIDAFRKIMDVGSSAVGWLSDKVNGIFGRSIDVEFGIGNAPNMDQLSNGVMTLDAMQYDAGIYTPTSPLSRQITGGLKQEQNQTTNLLNGILKAVSSNNTDQQSNGGIVLQITNFNNNRDIDIKTLMEEMEYYRRQKQFKGATV